MEFLFATGIECSAPVIAGAGRRDQLDLTFHRHRFAEDFAQVAALGIPYLRVGVPFHEVAAAEGGYDWSWTDRMLAALREQPIEPIVDLLHFGVPARLSGFGDPRLPGIHTAFVAAFAERYPWVRWYTPVNEPFISALFSARFGWWNEQATTDAAFLRALDNTVTAAIEGMRVIRERRPDARFLQSDACESYRPGDPTDRRAVRGAAHLQERSWLGFDLTYGRPVSPTMRRWLLRHGLPAERLAWLEANGSTDGCVVGLDYYEGNEHLVDADGSQRPAVREGLGVQLRRWHDRYGLPVMLAETNIHTDRAIPWLTELWNDTVDAVADGLPVTGFCWYSLTDQVDWDTCMRQADDHVDPLGLVDLERRLRPVGAAYQELASRLVDGAALPRLPADDGLAA